MASPLVCAETPHVALACACILGEGPVWDHRTGTLLWVDIKAPAVWRYSPGSGESSRLEVAERVGFVALTEDPEVVVAGFKSGLARLELKSGASRPLVGPEPDTPGNRINDGCVGPDGVLYFGTMDDAQRAATGRFWRFDGTRLEAFGPACVVTNGPAVSPDGRTLYAVDSPGRRIHALDVRGGEVPGAAREFARFDDGWGYPDGLVCDADGHVWVCHWAGSRVTRFAPDGSVERVVPMPTANVTKCAFGGNDLTTLYVTTAAEGRDPHIDPMAGHLYAVDVQVKGLASNVARVL